MIRDRRIKYWHFNGLPDVLFDLEKDPGELRNRAEDPEYRDIVQQYRLKLMDWRMSTEDPSRIAWTYALTAERRRPDRSFWDR
jgi:arylsulfatase A-like enzyme